MTDEHQPGIVAPSEAGAAPETERTFFAGKWLFWIPIAPLVALDLWSKTAAFDLLIDKHGGRFDTLVSEKVFSTRFVDFELVSWLNRGTIWGLGSEMHGPLKYLRLGAIALIVYFVYRTPRRQRLMLLALSLILAGALGNMYDNFLHHHRLYSDEPRFRGAVRDFLHFYKPGVWNFPAFNVADSCITVGAITLFLLMLFEPRAKHEAAVGAGSVAADAPPTSRAGAL